MTNYINRFIKRTSKKTGRPPGSLEFVGDKKVDKIKITVIDYDEKNIRERVVTNIEDCFRYKETSSVTWINIDGLHDVEIIQKLGDCFDIHSLVLEDIMNTAHRPKVEEFENYIFIVLKMLSYHKNKEEIISEQVSLILGRNYVISFQEWKGDIFDPIRERLKSAKGRIRQKGSDYLAYAIIDVIVDNYYSILEEIGEQIESLESDLMLEPEQKTLQDIYKIKRENIFLRKSVWPLRELLGELYRNETELIDGDIKIFLRDVYDHTIQIVDNIESYRDVLSGLIDLYLSSVSNKMNQIMKVLTIIATIFIPLTFIAGIYGMNFNPDASPLNMPELEWYWGYLFVWIIMMVTAFSMVLYFKKKKWL